jgi:glycine betaine catabolism B
MSITRTLHGQCDPADLIFLHNARTPQDIIFRDDLDDIAARPDVQVHVIGEANSPTEERTGTFGRLTLPTLLGIAPDLTQREIFVYGPPQYMSAVRDMLGSEGVDPHRYHEESFDFASSNRRSAPPQPETSNASREPTCTIEFRRSGTTFACGADETILNAALRNGVNPLSSCTEGVCGTCKSTVI